MIDIDKWMLMIIMTGLIIIPMAIIIFSLLVAARRNNRLLDEYMVKETLSDINK
jgi:uncharacterized membrane protein